MVSTDTGTYFCIFGLWVPKYLPFLCNTFFLFLLNSWTFWSILLEADLSSTCRFFLPLSWSRGSLWLEKRWLIAMCLLTDILFSFKTGEWISSYCLWFYAQEEDGFWNWSYLCNWKGWFIPSQLQTLLLKDFWNSCKMDHCACQLAFWLFCNYVHIFFFFSLPQAYNFTLRTPPPPPPSLSLSPSDTHTWSYLYAEIVQITKLSSE